MHRGTMFCVLILGVTAIILAIILIGGWNLVRDIAIYIYMCVCLCGILQLPQLLLLLWYNLTPTHTHTHTQNGEFIYTLITQFDEMHYVIFNKCRYLPIFCFISECHCYSTWDIWNHCHSVDDYKYHNGCCPTC